MKERLLARGYSARAAASIATAWAYEQREALRAAVAEERDALRATLDATLGESWRQYVEPEAASGNVAAGQVLDEMRHRDGVAANGTTEL